MSEAETIEIIRNQIQNLGIRKISLSNQFDKIDESLQILLQSMDETDERTVNGIDVMGHKHNLESMLKDFWQVTEDDLESSEQKERFALELERALIIGELTEVKERIASWNKRMITINPSLPMFGVDEFDKKSLEAYAKIANLEREIRNYIIETLENKIGKNWWSDGIPDETKDTSREKMNDAGKDFEADKSMLREIDFLDFSDYEKIFQQDRRLILEEFFNNNEVKRGGMISKLSELRPLRNKIMHRQPLDDNEYSKLQVLYSDIINEIKKTKERNKK